MRNFNTKMELINRDMDQEDSEKIIKQEVDHQVALIEEYFDRHISTSSDLEYIALRSHLLAEYYLNHLLVLKDDPENPYTIERLSFFEKIKKIKELKIKDLKPWVTNALFSLNRIRNNLSHSLEYKISEADVDSLGFNFGKDYIYRKFSLTKKDLKTNFSWVIKALILELYRPIAIEITMESIKKKEVGLHKSQNEINQPDLDANPKG